MTQPRITISEVLAAYEKCGLKPRRSITIKHGCACPVGALYAAAVNLPPYQADSSGMSAIGWAESRFGLGYIGGFMEGFDNKYESAWTREEKQGYADGVAVAAAIFGENNPNPAT